MVFSESESTKLFAVVCHHHRFVPAVSSASSSTMVCELLEQQERKKSRCASTRLQEQVQRTQVALRQWQDQDSDSDETSAVRHQAFAVLTKCLYGKCILGLAGALDVIREKIAHFLTISRPTQSEIEHLVDILGLFAQIVDGDQDNAALAAQSGMHLQLLKLLYECPEEDLQEATAEAIASCCTSPQFCFPFRCQQLDKVQRVMPHVVQLPSDPPVDATCTTCPSTSTVWMQKKPLEVVIRQVSTRMTGQAKTGYLLWGAAFVLARFVQLHRKEFLGKRVLEVGSGLGLSGIVAGRYAKATTLTDYQQDTLDALAYNVKLNEAFINGDDDQGDEPKEPINQKEKVLASERETRESKVTVEHLDWDELEESSSKYDMIIASDIICEPSTAEGFLRVIRHRLDPVKGVAYLMNANSHSRFGVVHLHKLLETQQDTFISTITPVTDLPDGTALLDTVSDAQILSYEFYQIRLAPCSA